jgi:hypothetical protein
MAHLVLLGDSILDNRAYVSGGPAVIDQVSRALPPGWRTTLAAVDGATIASVRLQLKSAPTDATHLVVSAGGNDALRAASMLDEPASTIAQAVERLATLREAFALSYRALLDAVQAFPAQVAVCTIYDPNYQDPRRQRLAVTALAVLNDIILREAFTRGLPIIDLRLICNETRDYANPIEPSSHGGRKIAAVIADFAIGRGQGSGSRVFR